MRTYELMLVLDSSVGEERIQQVKDRLRALVTTRGGSVVDEEDWGKRKLAYRIKGKTEATYWLAHLELESGLSEELQRSFNISEEILRHLLLAQDHVAFTPCWVSGRSKGEARAARAARATES